MAIATGSETDVHAIYIVGARHFHLAEGLGGVDVHDALYCLFGSVVTIIECGCIDFVLYDIQSVVTAIGALGLDAYATEMVAIDLRCALWCTHSMVHLVVVAHDEGVVVEDDLSDLLTIDR